MTEDVKLGPMRVTHVILDSGVMLHAFGSREEIVAKVRTAERGGEMFLDLDVQNEDVKDPVTTVTIRLYTITMIGRDHDFEGPTSLPIAPPVAREGVEEVSLG